MRPTRILLACTAAGAITLVPAAAAFATPAGHGHTHGKGHGHGHTHGKGHGHGKGHSKLDGARRAADHVVAAQGKRLNRSLANATSAAATALNPTDRAALVTALQGDLDALSADAAAIPSATTVAELNAIKHAAVGTVTVAVTQVSDTFSADGVEAQAAADTATLSALANQVATAAQNGQDMTAAQAALDDAQTQVATATSDAQSVVTGVLALSPTASHADVDAASNAADLALTDAATALDATTADIATVNDALGN